MCCLWGLYSFLFSQPAAIHFIALFILLLSALLLRLDVLSHLPHTSFDQGSDLTRTLGSCHDSGDVKPYCASMTELQPVLRHCK